MQVVLTKAKRDQTFQYYDSDLDFLASGEDIFSYPEGVEFIVEGLEHCSEFLFWVAGL